MKTFMIGIVVFVILSAGSVCATEACGDANGDGVTNITDLVYMVEYLFGDGPPPPDFNIADFDGYELLTISDVALLHSSAWACDIIEPLCPPDEPPLEPVLDPNLWLMYPDHLPADSAVFTLPLTLKSEVNVYGMCLPFEIRVEGALPTVDSIRLGLSGSGFETGVNFHRICQPDGEILIGMQSLMFGVSGVDRFAEIFLSMPPSATDREISIDWVSLSPEQAPEQDSSLYPMIVGYCGSFAKVPQLYPHCCVIPGDADQDGVCNISDAVYQLCYIFWGCELLCADAENANGDANNNISDAIYIIQYVFNGGPPPVCGYKGY